MQFSTAFTKKGVFGRRSGVEAIGSISQGDRSNRDSFAPEGLLGAIGPTRLEVSESRRLFPCPGTTRCSRSHIQLERLLGSDCCRSQPWHQLTVSSQKRSLGSPALADICQMQVSSLCGECSMQWTFIGQMMAWTKASHHAQYPEGSHAHDATIM